jgi:hypothetical protein
MCCRDAEYIVVFPCMLFGWVRKGQKVNVATPLLRRVKILAGEQTCGVESPMFLELR